MGFVSRLIAAMLALGGMAGVPAQATTVASPGGTITVSVDIGVEGRAVYSIARRGTPLVAASQLGFLFTDAPQIARNMAIDGTATREVDESWTQPWGEWTTIRNRFRELRVHLRETTARARRLDVVFRAYDDGVGFRYEFPDAGPVNIAEELTQFNIAQPATAWWCEAFESNREEMLYHRTPIAEIGTAQTPLTLRLADGTHIAIHEAALVDYAGMNIGKVEGGLLKAVLTPSSTGPKVSRMGPFAIPWRVLMIAADAPGLYLANRLILNLNEPNKLGDVSWVHPRKYMGIWWGMHLGSQSWASGQVHGATTANAMKAIDFAAANGFGGLLVEGWNKGWDSDWFADGSTFSFTESYPDFDLPRVEGYAKAHGMTLIGHHETSANIAHYEEQLSAALDLDQQLGIDTVKTGYVSDAGGVQARGADGQIHFEWHEGQVMARHHLLVVTEAAKRHIAVVAHEPIKDTGLRRTYPNWLSREGQRGMEYNAWGNPKNPPEHEANLVFTRMLGGPMDFTPGVLSLKGKGGSDILSTAAKQLALYIVLYSPVQMAADLPENYARFPAAFKFIKDVAVDWADTRVLNGAVGDYVTIARKDRRSENWYVGAVTNAEARTLRLPLNFLTPGKRYTAQIYRDGPGADYRTEARHAMTIESRVVMHNDTLTLWLAPGGGAAVRFVAMP